MEIPRLHPDTIEQVKQRVDIVDVVSEYVVLRKQGKDFVGLCPFHDDKSPSFSVSPSKQFYYCFSCGAGGNAFKFLMELGKRSFGEVVLDLAKRYQVPLQTLEPAQRQELQRQISLREQLYEILALTARFYEHALHQATGEGALRYLQADRGLSQATIQQFQLGYAPAGWQTLYGYLIEQKHYPVELVEKAGLVVPRQGNNGYYDRFRDRLMIPIHDLQGRVIGFGGRSLGDEQPKYLNSPETELFDKGKTLFALDKARAAIAKQDKAVVVEGYFDVIALHAAGIVNVVASLGTALSLAQVRQLLRYTESKQVVLNFDADAAGTKAAERAIGEVADLAYQGAVKLRILTIPEGKDPDEFLKHHAADDYQALLDDAPLWLDWQLQAIFADRNLRQADQFQQATQDVVKLLGDIANADTRTHYVRQCAELLSNGDSRLVPLLAENLLAQVRRQRRRSPEGKESPKIAKVSLVEFLEQAEATLLRIYLHSPDYRQQVVDALEERDLPFSLSHHRFLWRQIRDIEQASSTDSGSDDLTSIDLVGQLRDRCAEFAGAFNQVDHLFQLEEKTQRDLLRTPLVIKAASDCLERVMCEKRYRHFSDLWQQTDFVTSADLSQYYYKQLYAEKKRMEELDRQRSITFAELAQTPWIGEFYETLGIPKG
ncbi:DNA primase [Oculatella sp. LEGE 06141]|uniref:DNA primase n=1 Tax=Oculatella sp. LEGE 06141 TaxID=1828648 RepID=UPI001880FA2B|nr:DNA primase [Oculatella sp. LEGE 06141]MBE9180805.1 DNA primase [Oculatella sp. LEGE 06141]